MLNPFSVVASVVSPLSHRLLRGTGSIFMFHRFADADRGNAGHDAAVLRADLAYLRRERYEFLSVAELISRLRNRDPALGKTVAFTVDDGYADFASVGAGIFAEFDCPVTVFVATGVVDNGGWFWWDRLREAMSRGQRPRLEVEVGGERFGAPLGTSQLAQTAAHGLAERLKTVPDPERHRVLAEVETVLDVDIAVRPPPAYAPMTWADVRRCGDRGVTFAPHTITHPILSRLDDSSARREIEGSWLRLREQTSGAVPVFCYPNGNVADVGARELATLQDLRFEGAVTAVGGYVSPELWHSSPASRYLLPRFGYNGNPAAFKQIVSGVLRARLAVQRRPRWNIGRPAQ